jgi:hypothetical protein
MRFPPILLLHICAGTIGLLSGAAAISFRKVSRRHLVAGNVFVVSMLTMAISATYLAFMKSQVANVLGGTLTFYMVATAWATARRKERGMNIFDWIGLLVALALAATQLTLALEAAHSSTGLKYGYPAGIHFVGGFVALLSATGDIRMLVRGGVFGAVRIAWHLWRMCYALFVASGSLFLGQQQIFPAFLRRTNVLLVLAFLPLILMIFWLVRVRFANVYKKGLPPRGAEVYSLPTWAHK